MQGDEEGAEENEQEAGIQHADVLSTIVTVIVRVLIGRQYYRRPRHCVDGQWKRTC